MARYAKENGVAAKTTRAGIKITAQFDRDLQWQVDVEAKPEGLRDAISDNYRDLLNHHTQDLLAQHGGKISTQYGFQQDYLFNRAVRDFGFEVLQNAPIPEPDDDQPVVY